MYYSQYEQDKFIHQIFFRNKRNGFFLDIGAHDGISLSNSYFFENELEWKGICVEPNPPVFEKLVKNRKSILVNFAVSSESKTVTFRQIDGMGEMLSGINSNYDLRHLQRIENVNLKYSGKERLLEISSISSLDLIDKYKVKEIDYLSIDTEGNEIEILKNFPFNKVSPKVITVENNYNYEGIRDVLMNNNYTFFSKLECDELYVYNKFLNFNHYFNYYLFVLKCLSKKIISKF